MRGCEAAVNGGLLRQYDSNKVKNTSQNIISILNAVIIAPEVRQAPSETRPPRRQGCGAIE
jgi:hypothetical protein